MSKVCYRMLKLIFPLLLVVLLLPTRVSAECMCDVAVEEAVTGNLSLRYRILSIVTILCAGGIGVSLPQLGKRLPALNPENNLFFMVKAFAAGVILATSFIHILPDAFDNLTSPCLNKNPWRNFPFTGFIAMMGAIGTLLVDTYATSFYERMHFNKHKERATVDLDIEGDVGNYNISNEHAGHVHIHSHATHGHAHGSVTHSPQSNLIRRRIISQVLEVGIIVHSVVIGISLGASQNLSTIKSLLAALSFHQFFEGLGLSGCISQAKFESLPTVMMAVFFSLTTPVGIAIGIGVSSTYKENSPKALIVEGTLNAASSGILIYMSLVDLLAADFMNPRMQSNSRLQLGANVSLLLGVACMSILGIWA